MKTEWEDFALYQLGVRLGQAIAASGCSSAFVPPASMLAILGRLIDAVDEVPEAVEFDADHIELLCRTARAFRHEVVKLASTDEVTLDECYRGYDLLFNSVAAAIRRLEEPPTKRDLSAAWFHLGIELADAEPEQSAATPQNFERGPHSVRGGPALRCDVGWLFRDRKFIDALLAPLDVELTDLLPSTDLSDDDPDFSRLRWCSDLPGGFDWWPVELGLLGLRRRLSTRRFRPNWDSDRGELRLGEKCIRRVSGHASNVRKILNAFEETSWPKSVDSPFSRRENQRLHEAIRSLNGGLIDIRFHADGVGRGVRWEWVDEGSPPSP